MTVTTLLPRRLFFLRVLAATVLLVVLVAGEAAAQTAGFVYVLKEVFNATNQIYGYRLDAVTGALTLLPAFPIGSGGTGLAGPFVEHMAYGNGRLYVINNGNNTLSVFTANRTTGALTALPFSPVALGAGDWACVAVHPSGSPVVAGDLAAPGRLASFALTATSATAAAGSPFSTGAARPLSCAFSQNGSYVYTGGGGGSAVIALAGFSVATSTGILTPLPGSPFNPGAGNLVGYATDRGGKLFSVGAGARVFTTAAGVPTGVTGNPFPSGLTSVLHAVLHGAGFYMVTDPGDTGQPNSRIAVLALAGSGAATTLTPVSGSPFLTGGQTAGSLVLTQDGGLLVTVHAGTGSGNLAVLRVNATTGGLTFLGTQPVGPPGADGRTGLAVTPVQPNPFDRDGDAKADLGVYRPSTGVWWILQSAANFTTHVAHAWGASTDIPVSADYDGDRKMDIAVYRPSEGVWYILLSASNYTTFSAYPWGVSSDIPVPGDYDADGKADLAVYRPSTGVWWILRSSSNYATFTSYMFGASTDIAVPADYDGDGRTDLAVYRPSTGEWWVLRSSLNYSTYTAYTFGASTDIPVPGDYDADGKADVAVFRPSTGVWYILRSNSDYTLFTSYVWGASTDIAAPADYDGDGRPDVAIFRPSTGVWWILLSSTNYTTFAAYAWGASGDIPLPRR